MKKGSGNGFAEGWGGFISYIAIICAVLTIVAISAPLVHAGDYSAGRYSLSLAAGSDKHGSGAVRLIGALWCPHQFSITENTSLSGRLEFDLGLLDSTDTTVDIGLQPVFHFTYGASGLRPYLDLGAGVHFLSRSEIRGREMGGAFQFSLVAGIGMDLNRNIGLGYRFLHISNANIHKDNDGRDEHLVLLSWRF